MERSRINSSRARYLSRRALVRGAAVGGAGLAAASLVGCGADEDPVVDDDTAPSPTVADDDPAPATVRRGGTVALISADDPPTLDPFGHLSFLSQAIGAHAYSRLLKWQSGPGIAPLSEITEDAAESYEIDEDGARVVFTLRGDARFHDKPPLNGRDLEAEDVVASTERFLAISPKASALNVIESVDAVDARTVAFSLNRPSASFFENITAADNLWIMSKEANAGDIDPTQVEGVIGTGPWMLRHHRSGVEIAYDANPDYYVTMEIGGQMERLPLLDSVEYLILSEYAQIMSQFVTGRIHTFTPRNPDIAEVRSQYPDAQELPTLPSGNAPYHWMNRDSNNALFQDERARQALSLSLDRDGLIDAFGEVSRLREQGIEIESGWPTTVVPWGLDRLFWWLDPKSADFGDGARWYDYDAAEARQLLDAAGYDGDTIQMNFVTGTYGSSYDQFTEAQIPMLREAGFNVEPTAWEYRRMIGSEEGINFPGIFYNWHTPFATIDEWMRVRFGPTDHPLHPDTRRYVTPRLLELVELQDAEFDRERRQELIFEAQRLSSEIMVAVPSVLGRWGQVLMSHPALRHRFEYMSAGYGGPAESLLYWWLDE